MYSEDLQTNQDHMCEDFTHDAQQRDIPVVITVVVITLCYTG